MKTITLTRKAVKTDEVLKSYRLDVSATAAQDITPNIFVKKRYVKYTGQVDDDFVAVASPANIEDFPENAPNGDSAYYRTASVSLVSTDPLLLESIFEELLSQVQLLVEQAEVLDDLVEDGIYSISATGVTQS